MKVISRRTRSDMTKSLSPSEWLVRNELPGVVMEVDSTEAVKREIICM